MAEEIERFEFPDFIRKLPEADIPYAGLRGMLAQGDRGQMVFNEAAPPAARNLLVAAQLYVWSTLLHASAKSSGGWNGYLVPDLRLLEEWT